MTNVPSQHETQTLLHKSCTIDPYDSAAMLKLGRVKTFVFAWQASARREFSARLAVQKPETQHGCRAAV